MRIPVSYQDGFKIGEKQLKTILTNLHSTVKSISENIIENFKITYIDNKEVNRPDIDSVIKEENGDEKTIQILTIKLVGNRNNNEIAHIYLEFAANPNKSITYEIQSDDETWCNNTQAILEASIKKVRKNFTLSKYLNQKPAIPIFLPYFSYLSPIIDAVVDKSIAPHFISSEYVFYWGETIKILEKRNEIKKTFLNVIIVGILIAFVVSIIGGIAANYITIYLLKWH